MDRGGSRVTFERGKDYTEKNKVYLVNIADQGFLTAYPDDEKKSAIMQVKPRKVPKNIRIRSGR